MKRALIFFALLVTLLSGNAFGQSQFGRYTGTISHSQLSQDQLVKLDFIVNRQSAQEFRLVAILSVYFGGFESGEYVSYHFDNVVYNVLTGAIVFDQPDQDVTFVVEEFAQGKMKGRLRSTVAGDVGYVELQQGAPVVPERALVQPLWGEYRGSCDGVTTVLQVQTSRSNGDSSRMGDPFGTYEISAQLAEVTSGCGDQSLCVAQVYDRGSYNFYSGSLDLSGRARDLSCQVSAAGLMCNSCMLKRTSGEAVGMTPKLYETHKGGFTLTPSPGGTSPAAAADEQLSGQYSGYLFHEKLGIYQAVGLNLVTYQAPDGRGGQALFVSGSSAAYFGDHSSPEFVSQRYNEQQYPLLAPQLVLERIDGDVDSVLQITQLGNGTVKGIWYSILFGRVGAFEMRKSGLPELPAGAETMLRLSGIYRSADHWTLDLRVMREATPVNTVNPFYPLTFKGAFRLEPVTPNIRIAGGAFDFYTGKVSMVLEDGTLFTGVRSSQQGLSLKRPTPGVVRPLSPHRYTNFARSTP